MPNKRALIVDDSTTAQYRLKKMLRAYDLDIDTADSGESALRYLATNAPAVIFMDHLMPGMDGFRALQIIKSHPETAMIPVIMYTSKSGDVYTGQARALGALDVVSKDTINAADLSKVMEAIHIYRKDAEVSSMPAEAIESKDFITAANSVSESSGHENNIDEPQIERRALNRASMEQARNLELRMSHLEHTLEDSRRFITSRVVRELHGLRENLKQELTNALVHQPHTAPSLPPTPIEPPEAPRPQRWPTISLILIMIALGVIATYLIQMIDLLKQSSSEQALLSEQVQMLDEKQTVAMNAAAKSTPTEVTDIIKTTDNRYTDDIFLADLSWAFNQAGEIAFHQNNIDPKALINLHEFLRRLIDKGFTGTAVVRISIGNFCSSIDNYGVAQLPPSTATLSNCMLSSEIYGLERVATQYQEDIETALYSLRRNTNNAINIRIETHINTSAYPERLPSVSINEWNDIAQANNRLDITLEAKPML